MKKIKIRRNHQEAILSNLFTFINAFRFWYSGISGQESDFYTAVNDSNAGLKFFFSGFELFF